MTPGWWHRRLGLVRVLLACALAALLTPPWPALAVEPVCFTSPNPADVSFGQAPQAVALGDLNNDGKLDLVVATAASSLKFVAILLGQGNGTFVLTSSFSDTDPSSTPKAIALGDFNNDGRLDVAAVFQSQLPASSYVVVGRGNGAGAFTTTTTVTVGASADSIAVGDVNNDGKLDFVVSNSVSNDVSIRLGVGTGGFTTPSPPAPAEVGVDTSPQSVALGDFDNDGKLDLVTANGIGTASVRFGAGDGTFGGGSDPTLPQPGRAVAVGDFSNNGRPDIALAMASTSGSPHLLAVYLGLAGGTFISGPTVDPGGTPTALAEGDFNNDGKLDVITVMTNSKAAIRLGVGNGSFATPPPSDVSIGSLPTSVAVGDLNNDGRLDFVAANSASNTVSIRLSCLDAAPVVTVPGDQSLGEDTTLTFSSSGGNAISVADPALGTNPAKVTISVAHGSLTLNGISGLGFTVGNGTANPTMTFTGSLSSVNAALNGLSYKPAQDFNGTDQLTISMDDQGQNASGVPKVAGGSVKLTVTPQNDPPTAVADSYSVVAGQTLNVDIAHGVLANDTDIDSPPAAITVSQFTSPGHGLLVTIHPDGSFIYQPAAGFAGPDSFTYKAFDGSDASAFATVTITVTNIAPTAGNDSYGVTAGTTLTVDAAHGVLANDVDPDGQPLSASKQTDPAHGTLTAFNTDGSFSYQPAAGYSGPDSFTYTASDGVAQSGAVTVTLGVGNTAPVAGADSYSITTGTTLTVDTAHGVLANDSDAEGQMLSAVKQTDPAHGTLTTFNADGSFTYQPVAGYTGPDSFTYKASDGVAQSSATTVSLSVGNLAPIAGADSYTVVAGTTLTVNAPGVLGNDVDPDAPTLTASKQSDPTHGVLTFNASGGFSYTPAVGFTGTDSFTYKASDGIAQSQTATATILVTAAPIVPVSVNSPPTAVNDSYTITAGAALTVNAPGLLANDTDPDSPVLTAARIAGPQHGALDLKADGSFTYLPHADFFGTDTFTYRASDGTAQSSVATVTITVTASQCGPRPKMRPTPRADAGALQVHLESAGTPLLNNNPIRQITFGTLQNARVLVNGQPIVSGQVITLPVNTFALDFTVERVTPGQATTVPFTVVDGCGEWPTFVGGGTGAGF
jgi:hypothetical protein